jgi:NUMOD4 motif
LVLTRAGAMTRLQPKSPGFGKMDENITAATELIDKRIWAGIPGWEDLYCLSDAGEVLRLPRQCKTHCDTYRRIPARLMTPQRHPRNGLMRVTLECSGRRQVVYIEALRRRLFGAAQEG